MKTFQTITLRLILGVAFMVLWVAGLFAITLSVIPTWGATDADVARSLPGDELVSSPNLLWTNAITIDASPEQVWPWIAQIGDTRGGFYSYTFIENKVGALTGATGYNIVYTNADEIHPDWQNPQPGQSLIDGSLQVRESEPGRYLLAESVQPSPFLWIWCWYVEPVDGGADTRLLSRFAIKVPDNTDENPVMDFMLNVGGFVMHQNMMQSIKLRAEGRSEPAWIESLEIGLWMAALLSGLVVAVLYLIRKEWRWSLLVASLSIVIIFVLTFVQPPIVVRFVLDAALIAAVVWTARKR
ncbi:MAG: hypothetical protein ACXW4M_15485 [Anaerolineales bacterium]